MSEKWEFDCQLDPFFMAFCYLTKGHEKIAFANLRSAKNVRDALEKNAALQEKLAEAQERAEESRVSELAENQVRLIREEEIEQLQEKLAEAQGRVKALEGAIRERCDECGGAQDECGQEVDCPLLNIRKALEGEKGGE